MPVDGRAAEVEALNRRYPHWSIWFGLFTGRWWALPPRDRGVDDLVEAETPQKLVSRIEVIRHASPSVEDPRRDARPPSRLPPRAGAAPSPLRRVPMTAWPGDTTR